MNKLFYAFSALFSTFEKYSRKNFFIFLLFDFDEKRK